MPPPLSPIAVTLRGRDRPIRFTIAATEEFEKATGGRSLISTFMKSPTEILVTDVITALHIGIKYGGSDGNLSRDRIRDMVESDVEAGTLNFFRVAEQLGDAITRATAYKQPAAGEEAAADDAGPSSSATGGPASSSAPTSSSPD